MRLQFIRRTHYLIPFHSYPKISSKFRFMYATLNVAASHGAKYNQTFPVGQHNHHTTLRVESNQSRRRPTSRSLLKLLNSGLYVMPLSRGWALPLAPPETFGPIVGKFREKVESLSLKLSLFKSPCFVFCHLPSPHPTVWSKMGQGLVLSFATCPLFNGS